MTHAELFTIPDFDKLSTHAPFVSLIREARRLQPTSGGGDAHHVIRDAGRGEGWKACLDKIEELLSPPKPNHDTLRPLPYQSQKAPDAKQPS